MTRQAQRKTAAPKGLTLSDWCRRIVEGVAGLNAFEANEGVEFHVSDRVAGAIWAIRCLANPRCEGSATVLAFVLARREKLASDTEGEPLC